MKCKMCDRWTKSWRVPFCREHWAELKRSGELEKALLRAWGRDVDLTPPQANG